MSSEDVKFRHAVNQHTDSNQKIDWFGLIELFPEHSLNELKKKWQALQDAQSNGQSNQSNQRSSSGRFVTIETPFSINSESIGHSISPRSVAIDQNNCQSLGLDHTVAQFTSVIIDLVGSDSQSTSDGYRVFDPRNNVSRKRNRESAQLSKSQNSLSSFDSDSENDQSNNQSINQCNYQFTHRGESRRCEQVIASSHNMRTHQKMHTKRDGSHQCSLCGWSAAANLVRNHITAAHSALNAELRYSNQPTAHVIPSSQSIDDDDNDASFSLTEEEADTLLGAVSEYTQNKQKINWTDISDTLLPHYTATYLQTAYQSVIPAGRSTRNNHSSNRSTNEFENSQSVSNRHQCDFSWIDEQGVARRCEQVADRADTIAKHAPLHLRKDGSHQCSHCGLSSSHSAVKQHMTRCHRALDAELADAGLPVGRILDRLQADSDDDDEDEQSDNEQLHQIDQHDQHIDHHGLAPAAFAPWTPDEDVMLLDAVSAHRANGLIRWTDFHDIIFAHRPLEAIQDRYNRQLRGKRALETVPSPSNESSPSSNIPSSASKSSSPSTIKSSSSSPNKSPSQDEDHNEATNGLPLPEGVVLPSGFVSHYTTKDAETVSDNQLYIGDWAFCCKEAHKHKRPDCYAYHGHGKLTMADGVSYFEGEFLSGNFNGAGWYITPKYIQWGELDDTKTGLVVRYSKADGVINDDVVFVGGVAGDDLRAGFLTYPDRSRVVGHRFDAQNRVKKSGFWEFASDSMYRSYIGEMDAHKPHGVGEVVLRSSGQSRFVQAEYGNIIRMLSQDGQEMVVPEHERDMFKQTAAPQSRAPKRHRQIVDSDDEEAEFEAPPLKRSGNVSRAAGDVDAPSDLDENDQPKQKTSSAQSVKWTERENSIITKFVQTATKKKITVDWKGLRLQLPGHDIEAIKSHARELIAKLGPPQQDDGDDSDDEDVSENDDEEYREPRPAVPVVAQPKRVIPRKILNGPKQWSAVEDNRLLAAIAKHSSRYGLPDFTAVQQLFPGLSRQELISRHGMLKNKK